MAAMDFPASPTDGQVYENYVWSASTGAWLSRGVTQTTAVTSDVAPSNPKAGDMWYNSTDGVMYLYYYDGNSYQWVQFKNDASFTSTLGPRVDAMEANDNRNVIINGAFDINQRGFTSTTSSGTYTFDRWKLASSGGCTMSAQVFTPGSAPVAGYEGINYARLVTTGQTGTSVYSLATQPVEDVRTLAGQTATISFWAKAASGTPLMSVEIEQEFGSGGSPSTGVKTSLGKVSITTSWTRYSITATIPSISGKTLGTTANTSYMNVNLWVSAGTDFNARTNSLGIQSNTFDIWGVQLQAGAVATAFHRNAPSLQAELAACQRYYYRANAESIYGQFCYAWGDTTTSAFGQFVYPVTMRIKPSSVEWTGTGSNYSLSGTGSGSVSNIAFSSNGSSSRILELQITGSSIVAGRPYFLGANNNASSYIGVSAEL